MQLTKSERILLDDVDLSAADYQPHRELGSLVDKGLVQAEFVPLLAGCFMAEVSVTTKGAAIARGLH